MIGNSESLGVRTSECHFLLKSPAKSVLLKWCCIQDLGFEISVKVFACVVSLAVSSQDADSDASVQILADGQTKVRWYKHKGLVWVNAFTLQEEQYQRSNSKKSNKLQYGKK